MTRKHAYVVITSSIRLGWFSSPIIVACFANFRIVFYRAVDRNSVFTIFMKTVVNRTWSTSESIIQKYSLCIPISVPRVQRLIFLLFFFHSLQLLDRLILFTIIVGIAWYEDCQYFNSAPSHKWLGAESTIKENLIFLLLNASASWNHFFKVLHTQTVQTKISLDQDFFKLFRQIINELCKQNHFKIKIFIFLFYFFKHQ